MHKICSCVLLFTIFSFSGFAQDIQFNDPDLLTYLTTRICVDTDGDGTFDSNADFNNDGQIQVSEALQVTSFSFSTLAHHIEDIGGFENFSNLEHLRITTIQLNHFDTTPWQSLISLRISASIDSYTFNNANLERFTLQNTGFNNPTVDLTNLPGLKYVNIVNNLLSDNIIFGTHTALEELRISIGTLTSVNLSGMPALKDLTISSFQGTSLDISNCTMLEEIFFRYPGNFTQLIGADASPMLRKINFFLDDINTPSNLDLAFNNQSLEEVSIRGANSVSVSNNSTDIGDIELYFVNQSITFNNCNFSYIDSSLDARLSIFSSNAELSFTDISGLRILNLQNVVTTLPLDLSTVSIERFFLSGSSFGEVNLKNGEQLSQFSCSFDTDIQFICVDSNELTTVENGYENINAPAVIHPYCTFVLGGDYYEVTGTIEVDLGTGCAPYIAGSIFDVQFTVTDGNSTDIFYGDNTNSYSYTLPEGNHTLSGQLVDSSIWTITPASVDLSFPTDGTPYVQDFCIAPNGTFNDLEITIVPITEARPGFDADYKIIYKNKGNTILSGNIDLTFNDDLMNFTTASPTQDTQTIGSLSWNYVDLLPFETREVNVSMLLNTPTDSNFPLNADDILDFTAVINPLDMDETPDDNTFTLHQTVVNSFDPNDIICLEGNTIAPEQVGKYVHYLIRFENNGSANAVNVVVKDVLDTTKFDINSLVPLNASHDFTTRIVNGNELEFIFENIQLPFDDATNDGYVLFKIKTLSSLVLGDSFDNQAAIYFDFNFPIITNTATTAIQEPLSVSERTLQSIAMYPNPTKNSLQITTLSTITSFKIYDLNGRLLRVEAPNSNNRHYELDVENLANGMYFLEVQVDDKTQTLKFIKN